MRNYETVVILKPDAGDTIVKAFIKKVEKVLTTKPGEITKKDDWGVKRFAYEIKKEKKGHYLFWEYHMEPSELGQLERALKFDETVLRYMTIVLGEFGKVKHVKVKKVKAEKPKKVMGSDDEGYEEGKYGPVRVDYKEPMSLAPFLTERGKIVPQRQSRFSATEQRALSRAIKRARQLALISYTAGLGGGPRENSYEGGGY